MNLAGIDPGSTGTFKKKSDANEKLCADIERLRAFQDMLFAQGSHALLVIFQGIDAAGKDSAIKHVMSGVNPQGVDVHSFKTPSARELVHDYLWRCSMVLPERGRIGIFNRSYYEELVIVRVHGSLLGEERLPPPDVKSTIWTDRMQDINAFERHLTRNGTKVLKFFLHISKEEQRKRLLERIEMPAKNWKLSAADLQERPFFQDYQRAYEDLLTKTNSSWAPWYVIPADHKWFTRVAIAGVILEQLETLGLSYPAISSAQQAQLELGRAALSVPDRPAV